MDNEAPSGQDPSFEVLSVCKKSHDFKRPGGFLKQFGVGGERDLVSERKG